MKVRHAIAVSNFSIDDNLRNQAVEQEVPCSFVSLITGDRVVVRAEHEDWCYGSRVGVPENDGLFPLRAIQYVDKRELTNESIEGASLVDEINDVTQRWWARVKELYSKQTEMHYLEEVLTSIDDMLAARKKILSGGVPSEELNQLRIETARKIDRGNLLLSLGVVIRQSNGVPFVPEAISLIQTYQEHVEAEKKVASEGCSPSSSSFDTFCVMLEVQSIELQMKYNCEISMALYDLDNKIFISDTFSFIWKSSDTTTTSKSLNIRALFSNFCNKSDARRIILISRVAQIGPIEASSSTLKKQHDVGPSSLFCRQVFAFDFFDVSHIFNHPLSSHHAKEKMIFLNREQEFDQSFKSLQVTGRVPKFNTSSDDIKLFISTQVFAGGNKEVRMNYPHLFTRHPPVIIEKTDINYDLAGSIRNDLFLTLQHGELSGKSSDRNIEARLAIVRTNGSILTDCFETTTKTGTILTSDYRSFVFYHEDKPFWMEQVKICLPDSTADDLHLRITFHAKKAYDKGKPDKGPFALAHVCLLQNSSLIRNEDHELLVYKIESSHYDAANTTYLALPQTKKQLRELGNTNNKPHSTVFSLSEKSSVHIGTRVASNVLTQNEHVLNVLRWRTNSFHLNASLAVLAAPVLDTDTDMMCFLCPLLDSLFEIWEERDQLMLPVFDVIVSLLKLIDDPRFPKSSKVFEKYMERFPFTTAAIKLIRCLNHYIVSAATTNNEKTRNSLKVMGRVFSTVVQSKRSCESFSDDPSYSMLLRSNLESVLESLISLMSETRERMAVQNTALKYLPSIVDPVLRSDTYEAHELCSFLIRVINGFGKNIVARERLGFVAQLIDTTIFESAPSRSVLLPHFRDLLLCHLDPDFCEQQKDFPDRALECVGIISSLMERLFPTPQTSSVGYVSEDELNMIVSSLFRPVIRAMVTVGRIEGSVQATRGKFFTLILALLNKMSAQIFNNYLNSRPNLIDKLDFLLEMVQMIRDLLSKCPFTATWEQMIMLQNKTIHKALLLIKSAIQSYFSKENFNSMIWEEFMLTTVHFVTQPSLQWKNEWLRDEGDARVQLRKAAAEILRSMWFSLLATQKMEYIPRLVGAFLEVSLVEDDETREATIPIFFDMMQTEFHATNDGNNGFKLFSDELISQLDRLVDEGCGNRAFQEQFTRILTQRCQSDKDLWKGKDGGRDLISRVDKLLGYLFEYRHVRETEDCAENAMSRTVKLMHYYKEFDHEHLYITYVYKLYNLHILYHNDVEAARTLMLHADLLTWEDVELADWIVSRNLNRHCATERQLKDCLLSEAANLFALGQMWEDAIRILHRELSPIYERLFYYDKLAELMQRIADLYRKVDKDSRAYFYFYLVAFYGKAFPPYLNGQRFVFRSDNLEMIGDFLPRMLQMYGSPSLVPTMEDCAYLKNSPTRHIQVFSVDPVCHNSPVEDDNYDVNPYIKNYYRHYNIDNFEFSRLVERKGTKWTEVADSEVMRTWIVKTRLNTHEKLPGLLPFSKVMSTSAPINISPLRRSVDQMELKNRNLQEQAELVLHNESHSEKTLGGDIVGVIQANVQGGIKHYEIFFTEECAKIYEPEEKQLAMRLSALIIEQVAILEFCLYAHSLRPEVDSKFHEFLIDSFVEYRSYVEKEFGKTHSILPPGASIYQRNLHDLSQYQREKSSNSNGSFSDLGITSSGTLRARGAALGSTMLNMLTPTTRKPTMSSQPSTPAVVNHRSSSSLLDAATRSFSSFRIDSRDSLQSIPSPNRNTNTLKRQTNGGSTMDGLAGIRLRTCSRDSSHVTPPPLPPREPKRSEGSQRQGETPFDRNILVGERHCKPPVATPILD